jgi:hypothetical protein
MLFDVLLKHEQQQWQFFKALLMQFMCDAGQVANQAVQGCCVV